MAGRTATTVGGTWQSVDDRHLTNDCAWAEKGENAFLPGARYHRDLEQPILNAIAAVAGIAGKKQHLVGLEPYRSRTAKKARQKMFGQAQQQALICRAYLDYVATACHGSAHG
jgi:fructose-1,6-bisphosphatase/inositol monophosphatase family enzyme